MTKLSFCSLPPPLSLNLSLSLALSLSLSHTLGLCSHRFKTPASSWDPFFFIEASDATFWLSRVAALCGACFAAFFS